MSHISEIELQQYLDHTLSLLRKPLISLHLSHCADCREKLEQLRKENQAFQELLPMLRRLDEADIQSESATRQSVTALFSTMNSSSEPSDHHDHAGK